MFTWMKSAYGKFSPLTLQAPRKTQQFWELVSETPGICHITCYHVLYVMVKQFVYQIGSQQRCHLIESQLAASKDANSAT
jgi:hypothetical protein